MTKTYDVFWIGGSRDGEILAQVAEDEKHAAYKAEQIAEKLRQEHEDELDPLCGGIGITEPDGSIHEW